MQYMSEEHRRLSFLKGEHRLTIGYLVQVFFLISLHVLYLVDEYSLGSIGFNNIKASLIVYVILSLLVPGVILLYLLKKKYNYEYRL